MKKIYLILLMVCTSFFYGCTDFDEIIDYREILYGGCCAFGEEVELTRQFAGGDGQSVFDKNSLFIKSEDNMFLYNNPESYWDYSFSFSELGLKAETTISPSGNIFSFLKPGQDSTAGILEFYTQSGGLPIYLNRDLSIKKESTHEVIQHHEFFDDNHVIVLLRDDSTGVQRFTNRGYDENEQKWVWGDQSSRTSDLIFEQQETIEEFKVFYVENTIDDDYYYLYFIDSQNRFRFFSGGKDESGIYMAERWPNGANSTGETIYATAADFNGADLVISKIDNIQDQGVLELFKYDDYYSHFYFNREVFFDSTGFLKSINSLQLITYDNQQYVVTANTADTVNNLEASIRLFGPGEEPNNYEELQVIVGKDQFASSFDVSLGANTLVIGDPSNDYVSLNAGAVHVYDISLNELSIILDQGLDIRTDANVHTGTKLLWSHIGWNKAFGDSIIYRVYRKIWESGQDYELIGETTNNTRSNTYEYLDHTAYLDTNYVYVVVPFDKKLYAVGNWNYHEANNSIVTKPINPQLSPRFYNGEPQSLAFEVMVNSGFLKDEVYAGTFRFSKPMGTESFTGSVWVDTLIFNYRDSLLTNKDMDYRPYVTYEEDTFLGIYTVGGAPDKRFGINDGVDSFQDAQPFVYMDSNRLQEGFGFVTYIELESVSTDKDLTIPEAFELSQNYPNPFNPSTNIAFSLPQAGRVQLKVFNMLGQEVASLVNARMTSGSHSVYFDASRLSSGVYIYRLTAENQSVTKKMLLIK